MMSDRVPAPPRSAIPDPASLAGLFQREEQLRERIGRALHDDIGQSVSAIKMTAHLAADELDPKQRREDMQALVEMADEVVARLRELHACLYPPQLPVLGLVAALRAELARHSAASGIPMSMNAEPPSERAPTMIEQAAFRIVQQLIEQALSRPGIRQMEVLLRGDDSALPLWIELRVACDDAADGMVPDSCQLRALSVGGELRGQGDHDGYRISIRLPYPCLSRAP